MKNYLNIPTTNNSRSVAAISKNCDIKTFKMHLFCYITYNADQPRKSKLKRE